MYNFSKKQKIIIGIILAIIATILINYVYSRKTNFEKEEISTYEENENVELKEEAEEEKEIVIHIAGAVKTEGIIFLKEGARLNEAIEKAGGTLEEADMTQVNLACQLEDGMKVYIPKKGEVMEENQTDTATSEKENNNTSKKININKATQSELETLPGIGPSTAEKIISHREEKGKFKTIENIKDVSGIGEAKYNSIKDFITV